MADADSFGQMMGKENTGMPAVGEYLFQGLEQFPDIARPVVTGQGLDKIWGNALEIDVRPIAQPGDRVHHQFEHILFPLAQRRQVDRQRLEPEEQVASEGTGLDALFEVAVGRGHHPEITGLFLRGANRSESALLQHPKKGLLHRKRQFTDFIEKKSTAIGMFDETVL